ncbi:MAG: hypothetical protein QOG82_1484 [Actinomycetota bacterium]|nr:hypothetical protein [Actinomycetota bacterium]
MGFLHPGLARAQPTTCPAPGDELATVEITAPEAGTEVEGRVEVRGTVEAPSALFQVELFVGDSRKDFAIIDPPATSADFLLTWDASAVQGGPATIVVVTCGGDVGPELIRGAAASSVEVRAGANPPAPRTLVEAKNEDQRPQSSLVAGAVIAVPAAAGVVYAMGRRRRRR